MTTSKAAVCLGQGQPWTVREIEFGDPGPNEVRVRMRYAGLCHSDEHLRLGEIGAPDEVLDMLGAQSMYPVVGGHEGSGVVEQVGDRVTTVAVGDHVAVSFVPSCGHCFWCASGRQHLCDLGMATLAGPMMSDQQWRHHLDGQPLNRMAQVGAFSEQVLCHELSLVKVPSDLPMEVAAVVSCGVSTGFGSSVNRGDVRPGEVVVVVGCGGVGHGALFGAVAAGAGIVVAVDPVAFKRKKALELGATHEADSMAAAQQLLTELTAGRMADVAVLTQTRIEDETLLQALPLISKGGRLVLTAVQPWTETDVKVSLFDLAMSDKSILGCLFGSTSPRVQIPRILDLYRTGRVPVDQVISRTYRLDQINQGFADMDAGRTVRGVIKFD